MCTAPASTTRAGGACRSTAGGSPAPCGARLSCHRFRANEVRLLLGVIAYNLGNLLRRLGPAARHPELVAEEPPAAAVQDRRGASSRTPGIYGHKQPNFLCLKDRWLTFRAG